MGNEKRPKLAPRVYWKHGAYHFVSYEKKWIRLGDTEAKAYEALAEIKHPSRHMLALLERYDLERISKKALRTQDEQRRQLTTLKATFGAMDPKALKPEHCARFHDLRGADAPVAANRELSLLSSVCKFGVRVGAMPANPCAGLARHTERPRERYVTDEEFAALYPFASVPLQIAMDLARLTGQREGNLLRMLVPDENAEGIRFPAQKRGKPITVEWSQELLGVVRRAAAHREELTKDGRVVPMNLLVNERGDRVTFSGFQSMVRRMWQRYRRAYEAGKAKLLVEPFTFHDLRAKAGSETDDERMLGHSNPSTFRRVYQRQPVKVKPIK